MRYQNRGATTQDGIERAVNRFFRSRVDGGRCVVENDDMGVGERRPRERDALTLPAGQRAATFSDAGCITVGQGCDEPVRLGCAGSGFYFFVRRVRTAKGDVVADRGGEEETLV